MKDPRFLPGAACALLLTFAAAACSDDTTANSDAAPVADQGAGKEGGGPGDGPKGKDGEPLDSLLPDAKQPSPDARQPAHWDLVNNGPQVFYPVATLLPNGDVLISGGYLRDSGGSDLPQKKAWRYQASKGTFVAAGEMKDARGDHDAVLLKGGKVLVSGGYGDKDYLAATELFDPATMKWTPGPSMNESRWEHRSVRLGNNWVLITGGFGSYDSLKTVTLYDPAGKFVTPAKMMAEERRGHTMTLLKDGRVLIAGGLTGTSTWKWKSSDTTEIYDPKTGSFTAGPKMSRPRNAHTATLRGDGTVLIVGGVAWMATNPQKVNDLYDPVKGTLTVISYPGGALPAGHSAGLLKDGRVVVIEDERTVAFSPKMGGVWDTLPTLPDKRWSNSGTVLNDGTVLVVGGVTNTSPFTLAKSALILIP